MEYLTDCRIIVEIFEDGDYDKIETELFIKGKSFHNITTDAIAFYSHDDDLYCEYDNIVRDVFERLGAGGYEIVGELYAEFTQDYYDNDCEYEVRNQHCYKIPDEAMAIIREINEEDKEIAMLEDE